MLHLKCLCILKKIIKKDLLLKFFVVIERSINKTIIISIKGNKPPSVVLVRVIKWVGKRVAPPSEARQKHQPLLSLKLFFFIYKKRKRERESE